MKQETKINNQIIEAAALWAEKLDSGPLDPIESAELADWLLESPRHVEELLAIVSLYQGVSNIEAGDTPTIETLLSQSNPEVVSIFASRTGSQENVAHSTVTKTRPWSKQVAATAASFAFVLVTATIALIANGSWGASERVPYVTSVGEQRSFTLAEGSTIFLNTVSTIETDFSDQYRDVYLTDGEAVFRVAHDPGRPFRVWVNDTVVQALGTEFNVSARNGKTTVTVIDGRIVVADRSSLTDLPQVGEATALPEGDPTPLPERKTIYLAAGEQATLEDRKFVDYSPNPDMEQSLAWRERTLVFRDQTLSDVAEQFNRYNHKTLMFLGEPLQRTRISGVFNADDPGSLVDFLVQSDMAAVVADSRTQIVLRRSRTPPNN